MEYKECVQEQIEDAENLLDGLAKVSKNDRSFVVALVMAYMNGIEIGRIYAQERNGKEKT